MLEAEAVEKQRLHSRIERIAAERDNLAEELKNNAQEAVSSSLFTIQPHNSQLDYDVGSVFVKKVV